MRAWIESLLPGRLRAVHRNSRVFSHGVYTRYPYQANTFGLPPQVAYECLTGYLAARANEASAPEPANFEEFCLKYFGRGFSEHFMIPYNQKLWGVHPREITAEWCSRFVPRPKLEDVIAGAVGMNDRELGYNADFLYPERGIGELSAALAAGIPGAIRLGHAPHAVDWRRRKLVFDDGELPYDVLISTVPLDRLIALLRDAPAEVVRAGERLICNPLFYLDVALDRPCGVDMHWAYVPEPRYPFYRVGCYSNFSELMAPPGKAGLYVELASREPPDMTALLPEVIAGLTDMRIIDKPGDVRFAELRRIDHAYVVFNHDYYAALQAIRPFLAEQRIVSNGRYGGWNYSSMEDALMFGRQAAADTRELLR
jgi:protoporphyrinogen oxidase